MDKYDEAIAYLTDHPDEIVAAWTDPYTTRGGDLFRKIQRGVPDLKVPVWDDGNSCGCLTEIRSSFVREHGEYLAETVELTRAIRGDGRIPLRAEHITVEHLPLFAEWMRRVDDALGPNPPARMQ